MNRCFQRHVVTLGATFTFTFTWACSLFSQVKPHADWRQIESQNFRIVYEAGLDSIARHAAARAEREHARLAAELTHAPSGKIDIIIADNTDLTNGYATPFPSNRIVIWTRPPVDELSLSNYTDWIDLVITHELTHVFHHEQAGTVGRLLRTVFGRIPWGWPVFPVIGVPNWNTEGLATVIESQHTGAGRVYGSYHEMVVRTAVLENRFPTLDRVSGESPMWPGGDRAYIYGSLFMDYIGRRYGEKAQTELIEKTAGSLLPPPWRMNAIAKRALGRSFSDLYRDWRLELEQRYAALADSLRAQGLTQTESLTHTGRHALHPRVSPDNRLLAYADENGRDVPATRVIDLASGADVRHRRNGIGPLAWLPDGSGFVTAQYEFESPYEIYSDLYLLRSGEEERLSKGARIETPDVSRDGRQIVYVQNVRGSNQIAVRNLASGVERVLVARSPDAQWTLPRWSPDASRIAVQRWTRDRGHDVVIIDANGKFLEEIATPGLDAAPAWSADGRYIIFSSDRTRINNLYAYDTQSKALSRITNLLTAAFYPEASSDGRWIYFSAYHADGFHIERIPFNPASWQPAQFETRTIAADANPPVMLRPSRKYSAIPSVLPRFWVPHFSEDSVIGDFTGITTAGEDDVGRHRYLLSLEYSPKTGRTAGDIEYSWAGLGNPVVTLSAAREWDNTGLRIVHDIEGNVADTLNSYEREDRIGVAASLFNRRWRWASAFTVGVEGVRLVRRFDGPAVFRDPEDELIGVFAGVGFGNARSPSQAISFEDGLRAAMTARRRFEIDPMPQRDQSYTELTGVTSFYKSVGGSGFAHSALAARASALHRTDIGPGPTDVGGPYDFLPVRGFDESERVGFSAWSASLEYRMPLALIARGVRVFPLFIDRVGGAFFLDAGNASCNARERAIYLSCAGVGDRSTQMLLSTGFELNANVSVLAFVPAWLRGGVAFPLRGGEKKAQFYLTAGPSF